MTKLAMLITLALVCGCGMRTLKQSIEYTDQQASLEGTATIAGGESAPIVVAVEHADTGKIADLFVLARPGPFMFTLPPGPYRLVAYEDRSRDLAYEPGVEPAALYGTGGEITLQAGERRRGADLTIDPSAGVVIPFAVKGVAPGSDGKIPALQIGTITSLDDPRFAVDNGSLGLWDPLRFMLEAGGGVYFLEAYDPAKIPVLFVHGATGSPADWKYLVSRLDRSRFQPWFAYYPAAPHLDRIGDQVVRALSSLQVKYRFDRMILVAHSMGGLVTRGAVDSVMGNPGPRRLVMIPAFVTLSSPWGGVASATLGVKYAPVVAPMWQDMAPGSAFLTSLPETPLPAECEYDLLFSYRSDARLSSEANDGTVTVASQLSMPIQTQATHVMGFDETHTSILDSPQVADELNAILARAAR
jgi:pimeloyl-ACP methyl ester carboxylesterase